MKFRLLTAMVSASMVALAAQVPMWADEASVVAQLRHSAETYTTAGAWTARRAELREGFLKGAKLWPLPERPPVNAIRHSLREHGDYSVENVALETMPGFYCTGNLYRPLGRKDLGPVILCPHGHFKPLGRFREEHQIRCAHFARMGATVFSYSMVGWHDSTQTTHDDPLVLALQTWNSIRAVDFLTALPRVDPRRVGVTGASGGGSQSMYLALVDDRVTAVAPVVIVYHWTEKDGCLCEGGLPVMQGADTNAIELSAAIAPRAQLLISVGNDPTQKFPTLGGPFIKQMYEVDGAGDRVAMVHFEDEKHDFGPSKRREVYAFFAKHLEMVPDLFVEDDPSKPEKFAALPEDLTKITIEQPEQMEVFNAQHPLPKGALAGSKAIGGAVESYLAELRGANVPSDACKVAEYSPREPTPGDEALLFTPPGFEKVGVPKSAAGSQAGQLTITIRDSATDKPTFCRVNVVGPDGNFYEPTDNALREHSLTGIWPKSGWGNRTGKGPFRYYGHFFYCDGNATVTVPAGTARIEVWKGFEYRPVTATTHVAAGQTRRVDLTVVNSVPMAEHGYWSGDPHIHIQRRDDADEQRIFDLLEAEDIHFATILAYNEPAGPYTGLMDAMDSPQFRGVGRRSVLSRGNYSIISGQEYRSGTYGHLNLIGLDALVLDGQTLEADNWPPYGHIVRDARKLGGIAFYAHGGYAQEIYADVAQGLIDGVELLQFGVYRGIGLLDWYHTLSAGFRVPVNGASDYPACRKLGDCITYVHTPNASSPTIDDWLRGMAEGRSFITTGPLLLLEVDGHTPGDRIEKSGPGPHQVKARVRVRSEVAPVTDLQLIVNGRVVHEMKVPASKGKGAWLELEQPIELRESSWIAARAFSLSPQGLPDAESHTNPVYVYVDGKAPYNRESLDALVAGVDKQIAVHEGREFPEQAQVVAYFERSRDVLMKIRAAGGAPAAGHLSDTATEDAASFDASQRTHTDAELREFLKPLPPKPIEELLRSFETVDGFEMQLVAQEPLVHDPIAAAFDEHGNLYVCEMRDYPYKPQPGNQPIGSVRLLKDTDGDGVFDEGHLFAEHLLWAGGIAPWKGGVFVAAPPDIWYFQDTDGDNRADVRRKVYTGFGTENQQAMLNNLVWGLDHKIYGSTAGNGGQVRPADQLDAAPIDVRGRDFRFDPVSGKFETITGTVQFGNTFDDWGNRFLCSESEPLYHVVLPEHYLTRNPFLAVPGALEDVAPGPVPIFRISPLERWRMIRSSRRIAAGARPATAAGASHHVIDAAAGVTIYRGGAYGPQYYGNVFVGDAQNNLIHRRALIPDGVTFKSERADAGTEFVRSPDNWFRPVNFVNSPDGTLYVLDMSREILETIHVPLDVTTFLDFTSGRDRGRIYRLAPTEFKYPGPPRLADATIGELVAMLESPHGWYRDTAHRLLYERQDSAAVEPLRKLLRVSKRPQSRLHALWSLGGINALEDGDLIAALGDSHINLREHAMRLAEPRLDESPELLDRVIEHVDDLEPRLQFQAAFSLGQSRDQRASAGLARLARTSAYDKWISTAILSSSNDLACELFAKLLDDADFCRGAVGAGFLDQLAAVVGARNRAGEVNRLLDAVATHSTFSSDAALQQRIVLALADGLSRSGARLAATAETSAAAASLLSSLLEAAHSTAIRADAAVGDRESAIRLLGCAPLDAVRDTLERLLDPREPEEIQLAAIRALGGYARSEVCPLLLRGWDEHAPAVRQAVVEEMLTRAEFTVEFLRTAEAGSVSVAQIDASHRELLLKHNDPAIRNLAVKLFGDQADGARCDVVAQYRAALSLDSDAVRGEQVYRRECMACHKIGEAGHAIGPDLASSPSRDAEALLVHVLDPNRYVLPDYEQYLVVDTSGRTYTGLMASQTATGITLRREEDKSDTILRGNIDELTSTGRSLMPEGFEKKINQQEMADLIAFLQSRAVEAPSGESLHIGTLPGLVEPEHD
jgi:putative membrane-bound dehydrogenase-like protein